VAKENKLLMGLRKRREFDSSFNMMSRKEEWL
jgi:hypothetical protein